MHQLNTMNFRVIFLLLAFMIGSSPSFAQSDTQKQLAADYLKQSEKHKKTGLIMLGSGIGATIAGTAMFGAAWGGGSEFLGITGATLMLAGTISTLVSIPVIVSSASKGKKAGKLSLGMASISSAQPYGFVSQSYPSFNFSIPITRHR
jgi:hypothetical protein